MNNLPHKYYILETSEKCNKYLNFVTLNLFQGLFKGILKQVQNDAKVNIFIFQKSLLIIPLIILSSSLNFLLAQESVESQKPVHVLDTPAEYSGWPDSNNTKVDSISLGLFLPRSENKPLFNAANMAISMANDSGGYQGKPFKLIQRWADDPWGAGSKEMIKLIYEDSVWAIIGSQDGAATHIAEQIVTKARVPLIAPLSADPTLNYVNIPWMFRLPPDFCMQASALFHDGVIKSRYKIIGFITTADHDGQLFSRELSRVFNENSYNPVFHFEIPVHADIPEIVKRITPYNVDALILHLSPDMIFELLDELGKKELHLSVFLPVITNLDINKLKTFTGRKINYLLPFSSHNNSAYRVFADRYHNLFGELPTSEAAYLFDSLNIIIRAIHISGLSRARLREILFRMSPMTGVTGEIVWDNGGGNQANPIIQVIDNSRLK